MPTYLKGAISMTWLQNLSAASLADAPPHPMPVPLPIGEIGSAPAVGLPPTTRRRRGIAPNIVMLRGLPLLKPLSDALCSRLAAQSEIQHFARGERVVLQGQRDDALYIFLSGRAYATRTGPTGRDVLYDVLEYGSHIGELGLIDGEAHAATVRCITPCKVLIVPGAEFLTCMAQSPELTQLLTHSLVQRLRHANHRIASLALQDVKARVLSHLHAISSPADGCRILNKPLNRTELAYTVGASREMVSRIVKVLQRQGTLREDADGTTRLFDTAG
ncbi:MAG: hypothetical protein RIQ53_1580 [Pseudomonadota bacterium]|jgi:CRP-like cAMP-binding protein